MTRQAVTVRYECNHSMIDFVLQYGDEPTPTVLSRPGLCHNCESSAISRAIARQLAASERGPGRPRKQVEVEPVEQE